MPKDPVMLLSYINTQLRDTYSSLEELCRAQDADMNLIVEKLGSIDYKYDEKLNKFVENCNSK